ncbi:MAG TPA: hypothetical protein PK445_10600 [Methanolinea sp.]|nr:hypothetical protein [Methanolinea sp.]
MTTSIILGGEGVTATVPIRAVIQHIRGEIDLDSPGEAVGPRGTVVEVLMEKVPLDTTCDVCGGQNVELNLCRIDGEAAYVCEGCLTSRGAIIPR